MQEMAKMNNLVTQGRRVTERGRRRKEYNWRGWGVGSESGFHLACS